MKNKKLAEANPALNLLTKAQTEPKPAQAPEAKPIKEKSAVVRSRAKTPGKQKYELVNGEFVPIENRSERLNLVINPTLKQKAVKAAKAAGISTNEFILQALTAAIDKEGID